MNAISNIRAQAAPHYETEAFRVIRNHFHRLTPREAVTVLGWLIDTGMGDPDPLADYEEVSEALSPVSRAYTQAVHDAVMGEVERVEAGL